LIGIVNSTIDFRQQNVLEFDALRRKGYVCSNDAVQCLNMLLSKEPHGTRRDVVVSNKYLRVGNYELDSGYLYFYIPHTIISPSSYTLINNFICDDPQLFGPNWYYGNSSRQQAIVCFNPDNIKRSCRYEQRIPILYDEVESIRETIRFASIVSQSNVFTDSRNFTGSRFDARFYSNMDLYIPCKSSMAEESIKSSYKTRTMSSLQSYLLSIAIACIFHKELVIQDDWYIDTFNFQRYYLNGKRFLTTGSEQLFAGFNIADYNMKHEIEYFLIQYSKHNYTSPTIGGLHTLITRYVFSQFKSNYTYSLDSEIGRHHLFNWAVSLESKHTSVYAYTALARTFLSGVSLSLIHI